MFPAATFIENTDEMFENIWLKLERSDHMLRLSLRLPSNFQLKFGINNRICAFVTFELSLERKKSTVVCANETFVVCRHAMPWIKTALYQNVSFSFPK